MVKGMIMSILAILGIIIVIFIAYIVGIEVWHDIDQREFNKEEVRKFSQASKINNVRKLKWLLEDIEYFLDNVPYRYVNEEDREEMIGIKYYVVGKLEILNEKNNEQGI